MIRDIAYFLVFGKPLVFYSGIITILSFSLTAFISVSNKLGWHIIPFKWHPRMAAISLLLAAIHGLLGLSLYF